MIETLSPKQLATIRQPFDVTLDVLEGTPRSSKTTAAIFRMSIFYLTSRDANHLIVAYNQEQAFRLFMDGDGFGLMHIYGEHAKIKHDEKGDHLEIQAPNGIKKIYYKGAGKSDSHKAITGMSLGSVVFGEINLLHMDMIQECFRRTFAAKDRYHLADLNPPSPNHPVIKEVFEVQKTRWTHWTIHDNPIITEERKQEIYDVLSKNPYLLARDWEGKRVMPEGVIYSVLNLEKHVINRMEGEKIEMFFVADGGQSDATSCSCNVVTKHHDDKGRLFYRLNRIANYYHSGKETGQTKAMSIYATEIKEFMQWCKELTGMMYSEFFVDPACKSLREELELLAVQTRPADNNGRDFTSNSKGIEVGIERFQNIITKDQFRLVETEKYGHYSFIKEVGMYARDGNGKPIDDWNHALDEARYASNYFRKTYV
jgi:PBSX family phage terminase large subunit